MQLRQLQLLAHVEFDTALILPAAKATYQCRTCVRRRHCLKLSCVPPQSDRNALQASLTETKRLLASTKEQHDKHMLESEADVKTKEAALAEAKAKELNDLREQHQRYCTAGSFAGQACHLSRHGPGHNDSAPGEQAGL